MTLIKRAGAASAVVLLLAMVAISPLAYHYFVNHNWRTVEEGVLYGSRQMSGPALERTFAEHGIHTVVNLRSANPGSDWYDEQAATCEANGVRMVDISWSSRQLPSPDSLLEYLDLLDEGAGPILVHCAGGTHRTGVAAAAYLLHHGATPERAREEFKIGFNDAAIGELVTLYERSQLPFRDWVEQIYPAVYESWNEARRLEGDAAK
jgi:protein tyrosine phosphatase (PTP) superfamily phosphohydrolase (DUF442 family)